MRSERNESGHRRPQLLDTPREKRETISQQRRHTEPSFACGSRVRWSLTFGKTNDEATNTHELNPDRVTVCDWPDPVHAGHVRVCLRLRPFSRVVAICQASPQCRPIHRLADVDLSSLYSDGNAASGSAYTNQMANGKLPRMRNPNLLTTDAHELATVHVGRMDVPEMRLRDGRLRKETLDNRTRHHTQHRSPSAQVLVGAGRSPTRK
jgi:hypothetical protein